MVLFWVHLGENWNLSALSFHHAFPCFYNELISLVESVGSLWKLDFWIMPPVESLKLFHIFVHLILIKILHLNHMTLNITLVNLMKPQLIIHPFHIALFLPISLTGTDHFTYLLFFMVFLQITTSTFLILMENPRTLQLKNIYKPLSISLTSLK